MKVMIEASHLFILRVAADSYLLEHPKSINRDNIEAAVQAACRAEEDARGLSGATLGGV